MHMAFSMINALRIFFNEDCIRGIHIFVCNALFTEIKLLFIARIVTFEPVLSCVVLATGMQFQKKSGWGGRDHSGRTNKGQRYAVLKIYINYGVQPRRLQKTNTQKYTLKSE